MSERAQQTEDRPRVMSEVLRAHLPRDRYDDDGQAVGTYCICGEWEGDYFADGEAGPFDDHLAAAVLAWIDARLGEAREGVAESIGHEDNLEMCVGEWATNPERAADAALGVVREALGLEGER